jgi:hypothetical protein
MHTINVIASSETCSDSANTRVYVNETVLSVEINLQTVELRVCHGLNYKFYDYMLCQLNLS